MKWELFCNYTKFSTSITSVTLFSPSPEVVQEGANNSKTTVNVTRRSRMIEIQNN